MTEENSISPRRLLVIGLDGAPYPLIKEWSAAGYLPNLTRLIEGGSFGVLRSTIPVHSPTAWASFMTGVNPGKHGVFDFVQRERDSYQLRVVRADQIHGATIWHLLSEAGYQVGVLNVPMTYPPEAVNGFLVSGLGTPDYVPYTYPPELSETLDAAGYRVNNKFFFDHARQDEWLDDIFAMSERRGETAVHLLQDQPWDFFMVVFRNTDEICHFYWHHMDETHPKHDPSAPARYKTAIRDLYQLVDKWVDELVRAAGEDTNVVIMSDHGAGPLYQDVFLNEWLWKKDWLHLRAETEKRSPLNRATRKLGLTRKNISDTLTRLNLQRLEVWIKKILGDKIYVLPRDERPEFMNAIDWDRTIAYSFGYYGQIYLNLIGREPNGTVPPEDYETTRDNIAVHLKTLKDPRDGRSVIDHIYFKEDLYHGPQLEVSPDILAIMRDFTYMTRKGYEFAEERGVVFREPYTHETGSHRLEGILIAHGPDILGPQSLSSQNIHDLAPTLLHLMTCSIPDYMDGRPILDIFTPTYQERHPITYHNAKLPPPRENKVHWDKQREAEIQERLKKLGYLR